MNTITMGPHHGAARQLARGLKATCRRPSSTWSDEYADSESTGAAISEWLTTVEPAGTHVTWVPGHDGTFGPGYVLATIVADTWNLPLIDTVERSHTVRSAHASTTRPTYTEQRRSLRPTDIQTFHRDDRLVLVDNAIATGASVIAAAHTLEAAALNVSTILAISHTTTGITA